jgi:SAM-dependent methyltransferase
MELMKKGSQEQMGKVFLEIGPASGENSIILAFSDVEKVYVNEINSKELEQFESLKRDLPRNVKKKLASIEGSCFNLLKKKPELKNTIDLILCRNVIHFFTLKEQAEFFQLVHSLLKPGGRGIFTVNSTFAFSDYPFIEECFEKNPDQTCFSHFGCFVYDFRVSNRSSTCIYLGVTPRAEETFSLHNDKYYLYKRSHDTQFKWKVYNDNFSKLDSAMQSKVKSAFNRNKEKIQPIKKGAVEMSINPVHIYSEKTLKRLFRDSGLEIETLFHVSNLGHLVSHDEASLKGSQIGIICKKP